MTKVIHEKNGFDLQPVSRGRDEEAMVKTEKDNDRGKWDNKAEFYLSCLGYAVGFGNVWRFPFLCYKNGGAAFLIPYGIMLVIAGFPLFFMELAIGQFSSLGANVLFRKMGSIYQGVGYSMIMVSILITIYFNLIFAWAVFYMFASFTSSLPWSTCSNDFNTQYCYTKEEAETCLLKGLVYFNGSCIPSEDFCALSNYESFNMSHCALVRENSTDITHMDSVIPRVSSSEDYFRNRLLGMTGRSWEDMGGIRWEIVACLAIAWFIIGICMVKGVKSSGKVVYVTATAPYVVLLALLIRGVTLEGAYKGIEFYFLKPNLTKLTEVEVWNDAATQIFYSLGSSAGVLITLSSYNGFKNNCLTDAITIASCNCMTSVFAGFVIFSILGFMANELQVEVKDVVESGSGLAFIAYPEAVSRMPLSSVWAILFFLMLITLGIDSQFSYMETIATAIFDQFPKLRKRKALITAIITVLLFLSGITMCLEGGVYMFELFVWYSSGLSLILLGLVEVLVIQYGYGFKKLMHNIIVEMEVNIPRPIYGYLFVTWLFITPLSLAVILIFSIYFYLPAYYGSYIFPDNIQSLGWCICGASIVCIPIGVIWALLFSHKPWRDLFKSENLSSNKLLDAQMDPSEARDTFKYTYDNKSFVATKETS